ncbi:MAG: hypothetical protein F6K17_42690 [Okeania sp. SIO3C4]|nr:hypothetical protein [Okeania sp. SIO3C4]
MSNYFSPEFLTKVAQEKGLSHEQQDVFVPRFSENKDYDEIARELGTSHQACLKRMGLVYKKFDIDGKSRGKESRLRKKLVDLSQLDTSLEKMKRLYIEAKRIQDNPSRYITEEPLSQQALSNFLLNQFINLLPSVVTEQVFDKRLSVIVDIITKVGFVLFQNSKPKIEDISLEQ